MATSKMRNLIAIALEYKEKDGVPKITAKDFGSIAEKIIEYAKEREVPIQSDSELALVLSVLEIDDFIPYEAYQSVAGILGAILSSKS